MKNYIQTGNPIQIYLNGFRNGVHQKLAAPAENIVFPTQSKKTGPSGILNFGVGSALGDILLGGFGWSNYRAGKAEAMGSAVGEKIPFNISHPITSSYMYAIGGGLAGAGIGALSGRIYGKNTQSIYSDDPINRYHVNNMTGIGATFGGGGGYVIGALLGNILRRRQAKKLVKSYNAASRITPILRSGNQYSFFSGAGDRGRQDAVMAMRGDIESTEAPAGVITQTIPFPYTLAPAVFYNKGYARGQQAVVRQDGKRVYDY